MHRLISVVKAIFGTAIVLGIYAGYCLVMGEPFDRGVLIPGGIAAFLILFSRLWPDKRARIK